MTSIVSSQSAICAQDDVNDICTVVEDIFQTTANVHIRMLAENQARMLRLIRGSYPQTDNQG